MVTSSVAAKKVCQVPDCGTPILAKGYCCKHYYQVKRNGAIGTGRRTASASAAVPRAPRPRVAGGAEWPDRSRGAFARCTVRGCAGMTFDQRLCRLHFIKMRYLGLVGAAAAAVEPETDRDEMWGWLADAVKD